jgi:hypothetical protein
MYRSSASHKLMLHPIKPNRPVYELHPALNSIRYNACFAALRSTG